MCKHQFYAPKLTNDLKIFFLDLKTKMISFHSMYILFYMFNPQTLFKNLSINHARMFRT